MSNYILNEIMKWFIPIDRDKPSVNSTTGLTRQELHDQIFEHFKIRFKEETTTRSMLFPTSFCILLHPDDYKDRQQGFAASSKDIAEEFHDFIRDRLTKYPGYRPHATYWSFQFSPANTDDVINGTNHSSNVGLKEPVIISTIYSVDFSANNMHTETNIRATKRPKNSQTMEQLNINKDALLGMNILDKDKFQIYFDKSFNKITDDVSNDKTLAVLSFNTGAQITYYSMIDPLIYISGKNDTRQGTNVLKLNSETITGNYAQIKYYREENKFKIAVFEKTKLNERNVQLSKGGDLYEVDLPNNSDILISDTINVKFKRNK
jgi:hypothetical protein